MEHKKAGSLDLERQPSEREGQAQPLCLEGLQLQSESTRRMTYLETISVSWVICNSWAGVSATVPLAISQGGPVTLTYGVIAMFILGGACAMTLAELASVYPTAGGQYHWTSILAPKSTSRVLSYCCGATNVCSWIAICTGIAIIPANLLVGIAVFWYPNYSPQPWHTFLVYQAINGLVLLYNITLLKRSFWFHGFSFITSIASFLVIMITCLACYAPNYEPSQNVWETFINDSGWGSGGVAFLTGLVAPNYMYAGIDGALHLAEECQNAATVVPRALMSTVFIGFVTSLALMVAMLYCTSDLSAAVSTSTGVPVYEMWYQATRSTVASTVFILLVVFAATFALIGAHQTGSRLTWSFARDNVLMGSRWLGRMHPTLEVPVWSLLFNYTITFIIGCIYLGSSSASNAFIGTGLVLQHVSYAFPAVLLMYRKRSEIWLPASAPFKLPGVVGWVVNIVTVCFAVVVLIFYDFPTVMPVTGSNMNYTVAVLGVMAIFAALNWVLYARKVYKGPRLRRTAGREQVD